ncbi:1867_t:CDS:2, partial [Dentiscutata erythropus]
PIASASTSQASNALNIFQANNKTKGYNNFEPIQEINDDEDTLLYSIDEVENFITMQFQDTELSEGITKFIFEIELDSKLLDIITINQDFETDSLDLEAIKNSFVQLVKIFILLLESGFGYY